MNLSQKWRLDNILVKKSPDQFAKECQRAISSFHESLKQGSISESIEKWQEASRHLRQLSSFVACLSAENVENPEAVRLGSICVALEAAFDDAGSAFDKELLKESGFSDESIAYSLQQRKLIASKKMGSEKETLACDLGIHGYQSWYQLYKTAIGQMRIDMEDKKLSLSQMDNLLSHPDRLVRKQAFTGLEASCEKQEELFAQTLRSIIGFRLQLYRHRGWNDPVQEALWKNRIKKSTLKTMWEVVDKNAPIFHAFCKKKAELLSIDRLSWFDLEAPFPENHQEIPYDEGSKLIVENFARFSTHFSDFSKMALNEKWIEAEDRSGKAPGGFCTPLPMTRESRIFMTYAQTMDNVLVLAHELGHAYHNHVIFDLPELAQIVPETLAETASTTAELLLLDGLLAAAKTKEKKKSILYEKAQRSCAFFLNIRARFLFEEALFSECEKGFVSADKLCDLMQEAQKRAYGNVLEVYHPYFWISKLHFYFTDAPCYNFPYTCGYLFSLAILAKTKEDPKWFQNQYVSLLKDTGRMSVEELAKKHLGMDPEDASFWQKAIDVAISDIKEFLC